MPHLVQLLLPLADNEGRPFARAEYDRVREELTEAHGGVTAHLRAPAEGAWEEEGGAVEHDQIVIYEVMTDSLDRAWWAAYRETIRLRFRQDELVVRAIGMERL